MHYALLGAVFLTLFAFSLEGRRPAAAPTPEQRRASAATEVAQRCRQELGGRVSARLPRRHEQDPAVRILCTVERDERRAVLERRGGPATDREEAHAWCARHASTPERDDLIWLIHKDTGRQIKFRCTAHRWSEEHLLTAL